MEYELSHLEKRAEKSQENIFEDQNSWLNVMPNHDDEIIIDEDGPEYDPRYFGEPVHYFNGRVIPPRSSPLEPFDPEVLAFMKSITPLVQMEPGILGGMPVFKDTLVPIKYMFDYLLAGRPMSAFLANYPAVSRDVATAVLENDATIFYEEISKAIDSAAMPSSRPR
ncbi:uncharacterized protein (DUF433 family) [Duganella sp. 1224]|uniref:DUF433 domain-containing protein n=1 Tax=Duganella sp. 1224 TaxID=2587052 RepID=UPI00180FCD2D|nr:DUF433 domain-containing protein [Duganella sp. 1224]NYE59200.1 uncharacterized protein (DUF433 family) [Duganella sp. 1224]